MATEKIYYAVVILLTAVSVLLSPFFYLQRAKRPSGARSRQWRIVLISNVITLLMLLLVWWLWLR
jgi:hypothetical protein